MSAFPYSFKIIDVARMFVDSSYQRPLTTLSSRIVKNFDPALVGTLVVSDRGTDGYAIVDGQTRAAAIAELVDRDQARCGIPCLVYRDLSQADEASLFARLQRERRGITSYSRFRADLVAGEPDAVAIQALVEQAGYDTGVGPKLISAVSALERTYRRGGEELLRRTLRIIRDAWGETIPNGDLIRGLGRLLINDDIDDAVMAAALAGQTLGSLGVEMALVREGRGHGSNSGENNMAEVLRQLYAGKSRVAA